MDIRRGQSLGLAGWSPLVFTVPPPSLTTGAGLPQWQHKQGLLLAPGVPGNDV